MTAGRHHRAHRSLCDKTWYRKRRAAYKEHLEGRKPALAMRDALDFLNREVAARGIQIKVHESWDWHTEEN